MEREFSTFLLRLSVLSFWSSYLFFSFFRQTRFSTNISVEIDDRNAGVIISPSVVTSKVSNQSLFSETHPYSLKTEHGRVKIGIFFNKGFINFI